MHKSLDQFEFLSDSTTNCSGASKNRRLPFFLADVVSILFKRVDKNDMHNIFDEIEL